jgi:hypothetical protein
MTKTWFELGKLVADATVTVALAKSLLSATLVAVTECFPAVAGAMYVTVVPLPLIVPTLLSPLRMLSTDQSTAVSDVF